MPGPLALVGGNEWREGCDFDRDLLAASGGAEVAVLPTAAAYEHPERAVGAAEAWFGAMGATVHQIPVLRRPDALDEEIAGVVRAARFVYVAGGSPMHLRSVIKDSPVWEALVATWEQGAVVAASSAGAMVLTDPTVDPRGGAFTVGLGLVEQLAFIPHFEQWSSDKAERTLRLAPRDVPVVAVDERTAVIRDSHGAWRAAGAGKVRVYVNGEEAGLSRLP